MNSSSEDHFQRLVCECISFKAMNCADLSVLTSPEVRVHADFMAETLITSLKLSLLGRKVREESKVEVVDTVPADWWQALRARWFPAWWLARWPVQTREIYATVAHQRYHVCPHVAIPKQDRHLYFLAHDGGPRWWEPEEKT